VYCSVLQCVVVCCSVLQCVLCLATQMSSLTPFRPHRPQSVPSHSMCCNVLQCVAMCCSVLHFVTLGNPEFVSHHSFVHNALNLGLAVLYVAVCCILLRSASQSSSSTTPSPITPSICVVLCYVLQCVAFCCTWQRKVRAPPLFCPWSPQRVSCYSMYCSVLQYVAACCSVLQRVAVCCSVLQCVAVCCSVLQCAVVCCSVLQCVAVYCILLHVAFRV